MHLDFIIGGRILSSEIRNQTALLKNLVFLLKTICVTHYFLVVFIFQIFNDLKYIVLKTFRLTQVGDNLGGQIAFGGKEKFRLAE